MENTVLVRLDVIDPHTFLEIELNYKELLQAIQNCGGYALYQQIYKFYGGKAKGFREIKKLEELRLVGSEQFSNNKYVYLKIIALKYLKFIETGEVQETVNRQPQKPSFRPLMNAFYAFEHYLQTKEFISTNLSDLVVDQVIDKIKTVIKTATMRLDVMHLVGIEKETTVKQLHTRLKILGDRNGIYLTGFQAEPNLSKSVLKFVCFDFGMESMGNVVFKYLKIISKLLNALGTTNKKNVVSFSLEIFTMGEQRREKLEKDRDKALKLIEQKNEYFMKNNGKENQVISGFTDVTFKVYPDIEGYVRVTAKGDKEFGFVDSDTVDRLQELRNMRDKIKGGESE